MYKALNNGNSHLPGYTYVRKALGAFTVPREGGDHRCLVLAPAAHSFGDLCEVNPGDRLSPGIICLSLQQILSAVDYLHSACEIIHTGRSATGL